ncbi:MAG TPA: nucleotidyl transferase AbiEii/AbiGii toxin family protein [Bacteroidales bacterium]|nr:nucleotidyl transferase AbiEii/AbiGii toxin family protein [Bacteroidales bacterium]
MKNSIESIKARLKNISDKENIDYQLILVRYFHERFLYRLSISRYKDHFMLKGGNLLYAISGLSSRPTMDIDFLGVQLSYSIEEIKNKFVEICKIDYPVDTVTFEAESIIVEPITAQDKYRGVRLFIKSNLGSIRHLLQIDIGFSDIVTPSPCCLSYPVLLVDSDAPTIIAYSNETVIAEKFQAMIELSAFNSRMKDFFDVYNLLKNENFDKNILRDAIYATFRNRNTSYKENHILFSPDFVENENRLIMWIAFLRKIKFKENLRFNLVHSEICSVLKPIWEEMKIKP